MVLQEAVPPLVPKTQHLSVWRESYNMTFIPPSELGLDVITPGTDHSLISNLADLSGPWLTYRQRRKAICHLEGRSKGGH